MGKRAWKYGGLAVVDTMIEETFDVVDENDDVVDTARRSEVHRNALMHRAVHVLVYDQHNRILVQQRGFNKDCSPGLWDTSAGGHVDSGENYDDAACRELKEELGIVSEQTLKFLFKLPANEITGREFVQVYEAHTSRVPMLQASELEAARWVSIVELKAWIKRDRSQFTQVFLKICEEIGLI